MAKVTLNQVQVTRVFWEGKGADVVERYTVQGSERSTKYSLFFDEPHGIVEGSIINVEGLLSAEMREWDKSPNGYYIAYKINKPRVSGVDSPVMSDKVGTAAVTETWPSVGPGTQVDDSAPF